MIDALLNAHQRYQLVRVLRELDPTAAPEQRRATRRKVLKSLWIRNFSKTGTGPLRKALLQNVSSRGVALIVHRPLKKDDKFLLPLNFEDGTGWLVLCEARNCRRLPDAQFSIGARFIDKIERIGDSLSVPADWRAYS